MVRTIDEICKTGAKKEHFLGRFQGVFNPIELLRFSPKSLKHKEIWQAIAENRCPNCGNKLEFRSGYTFGVSFTVFRTRVAICVKCDEAWIWEEED